jgi:hypothetical protein
VLGDYRPARAIGTLGDDVGNVSDKHGFIFAGRRVNDTAAALREGAHSARLGEQDFEVALREAHRSESLGRLK